MQNRESVGEFPMILHVMTQRRPGVTQNSDLGFAVQTQPIWVLRAARHPCSGQYRILTESNSGLHDIQMIQ